MNKPGPYIISSSITKVSNKLSSYFVLLLMWCETKKMFVINNFVVIENMFVDVPGSTDTIHSWNEVNILNSADSRNVI